MLSKLVTQASSPFKDRPPPSEGQTFSGLPLGTLPRTDPETVPVGLTSGMRAGITCTRMATESGRLSIPATRRLEHSFLDAWSMAGIGSPPFAVATPPVRSTMNGTGGLISLVDLCFVRPFAVGEA